MPAFAAYVVAVFAILFSALSALTWIYVVRHVDAPTPPPVSVSPVGAVGV